MQLRRILPLVLIGIALIGGIIASMQEASPIESREQVDGETIVFTVDRDRVFLPNTCVQVWWEVSGVERVLVNDRFFPPAGTRDVCVQADNPPQLFVTMPDDETHVVMLDVDIVLLSPLVGGVVLVFVLGAIYLIPARYRLWLIGGSYVAWAAFFIYQTSFVALDGERYFSLFDDAMISMRYAYNLANGQGLVWNAGEYVEGYTNLLMVLLMTVPSLALSKPLAVLAVQVIGVMIVLAIAYFTMQVMDRLLLSSQEAQPNQSQRRLWRHLFFTMPLIYYPVSFWTLLGMETGLLTLLLLVSLYQMLAYIDTERTHHALLFGMSGGAAYLTRPDALIPIGLMMVYFAIRMIQQGRLRVVALPIAIIAVAVGGQLLFRVLYYSTTVPNTYTLKVAGIPLSARLENGIGFLGAYFQSAWLFGAVIVAGLGLAILDDLRSSRLSNALLNRLLPAAILGALVTYQIYVGGDPWPLWRMLVPGMVLALPLFLVLAHDLITRLSGMLPVMSLSSSLMVKVGSVSVVVGGIVMLNAAFAPQFSFQRTPYDVWQAERNLNTALALSDVTLPDARIAVIMAGTLPYYLDRYTVDMLGKMDPVIAGRAPDLSGAVSWNGMSSVPGHNKYDLTYSIETLTPGYIPQCFYGQENLCDWVATRYLWRYYQGVELIMLGTSPYIRWDLLQE